MEHLCQRCGTTVEDGRPFCPQCRAPQINVQIAVPDAVIAAASTSVEEEFAPRITQPSYPNRPVLSRNAIDRRTAVRAAFKAGVLGVFIGAIPFIGIVLTGALAVFFYRRKSGSTLSAALAARIGGAAGVVVFAIGAVFTVAVIAFHAQQQCVDLMMTTFQRLGANTSDPELQASIQRLFTPLGQAISFFAAVVSASFGGALASLFLRSGKPRQ